jgi:hypothetical protein
VGKAVFELVIWDSPRKNCQVGVRSENRVSSVSSYPLTTSKHHGRVVPTGEITSPEYDGLDPTGEIPKYSNYLCFTISIRTNRLGIFQEKYTPQQDELHNLIKSLHDGGMGYRKIAYCLNNRGIRTSKGNPWKNTQVYSVLLRYRERKERLVHIETDYPLIWGKMRIEWMKN